MSFFKIILEANIRSQSLRIPPKFIRKFGDELSDTAVLKVLSGKVWSVGLRKSDGKVWFDKGWQEFVEFHSILENHFLVFRYDGNSNFNVSIFNTTACEIEYPCECEENNPKGGCQIEEMEEQSYGETSDVPPRLSVAASRKVIMIDESEEQQMTKSRERSGLRLKQKEKENENIPVAQMYVHPKDSVARRPILAREREQQPQAAAAAAAFKSTNTFCNVKMQPSYLSGLFYLNVPRSFARTALAGTSQSVTLWVPDGRKWIVYCNVALGGSTKITRGWKVFAQENNLKEGDICIFELVRKSSIELKVSISRFTECGSALRFRTYGE